MLNLLAVDSGLEEQLRTDPQYADHSIWQTRSEMALRAADRLLADRIGWTAAPEFWAQFWEAVPDAWMERNTWRALTARNQALRTYLEQLAPGEWPNVVAMQSAYFAAAEDPAPDLRASRAASSTEEVQ